MISKFALQCVWSLVLSVSAAAESAQVQDLQHALSFYKSLHQLEVDFKQVKTLKDLDLHLPSEGHLSLKMPDHVEWRILKPEPLSVTLNKDQITIRSGGAEQKFSQSQTPSARDRESFASFLSWLKLDAAAIAERYDIQKTSPRHYHFTAKEPAAVLQGLDMELAAAGSLEKLVLREVSGDEISLHFGRPRIQ